MQEQEAEEKLNQEKLEKIESLGKTEIENLETTIEKEETSLDKTAIRKTGQLGITEATTETTIKIGTNTTGTIRKTVANLD